MMGTVAQNMQRKEINILRKIVHQVGFIYKILTIFSHFLDSSCDYKDFSLFVLCTVHCDIIIQQKPTKRTIFLNNI